VHHGLVGAAVQRTIQRRCSRGGRAVGVGVRRRDHSHRGGAAVLLVVGVQDEQKVHRFREHRVDAVVVADAEHHVQEVRRVVERVVRRHKRQTHAESVTHRSDGRRFRDEAQRLLGQRVGIVDVFCVGVEGAERRGGRHEHAHRVRVVVEAVDEPLAHVLVDHRVVRDVKGPLLELRVGRQFAVQQQVGDFEEGRLLRKLFDRITAIAQDARVAVEVGDRRLARGGGEKRRVVHPQFRVELTQCGGGKDAAFDRDGDLFARAVVGDRDRFSHREAFRCIRWRELPLPTAHATCRRGQSGPLSCFRRGNFSRLLDSMSRAAATSRRVSVGVITASTYPRSAAT